MKRINIRGYEIDRRIGASESCVVYRANQVSLERVVVLKVLKPELAHISSEVAKFKLQAHATENLRHVNIVQTYASGECDGTYYIVRELIDGCNLLHLSHKHRGMPFDDVITIMQSTLDALESAWQHGSVLHANLKPENILIGSDNVVKLTDFSGLTHESSETLLRALGATQIGDPDYTAPELAAENLTIDFRSDIYSLGAILYRMLTGRTPFERKPKSERMAAHLNGHAANPLTIDRSISTAASVLAQKMMIKDPSGRYDGWDALRADLDSVAVRRIPLRGSLDDFDSTILDRNADAALAFRRATVFNKIKFALIYLALAFFGLLNIYLIFELNDFFGLAQ